MRSVDGSIKREAMRPLVLDEVLHHPRCHSGEGRNPDAGVPRAPVTVEAVWISASSNQALYRQTVIEPRTLGPVIARLVRAIHLAGAWTTRTSRVVTVEKG
jgi:hypothetical protein